MPTKARADSSKYMIDMFHIKFSRRQKKEDAVIPEQPHLKKELRVKKEPEEKLPRAKISMEVT